MQSLIFCGDLVVPFGTTVDYNAIKHLFLDKTAVVNLEGGILPSQDEVKHYKWNDKYSLYSSPSVMTIMKDLNVRFASLCNNHILDYKYDVLNTVNLLKNNGIESWGLKNHDIIETEVNRKKTYIITFSTFANEHSLNLYNPDDVVEDIQRLKRNEDCFIVVYPHWGIEKLEYPEPADRMHAHRCIDAGADIIIGHHPHIIQGIEIYKGKYIIYSIGNFILPQTYYGEKKLVYKNEYIQKEIVVEWDGTNVTFHPIFFDRQNNSLVLDDTFDLQDLFSVFSNNPSDEDYWKVFKEKIGVIDKYIKIRNSDSYSGEVICFIKRKFFRFLRKCLIILRIHKPE